MKNWTLKFVAVVALFVSFSFTSMNNASDLPINEDEPKIVTVSYYGKKFHGRLTANGEKFDMNALTCAHKTLKFGTKVKFTNPRNGKSVVVKVNDRGPYIKGRTFDLSKAAFSKIEDINRGVAKLEYEILN